MSKLIYKKPAKKWKSALPLGNGSLAAMVYGGIRKEKISFNDSTLWSGFPRDYTNPNSLEQLDKARELIFNGEYEKAEKFVQDNLHGEYGESFIPLADLVIRTNTFKCTGYKRILDLDDAIFRLENGNDTREAFISYPDKAFIYDMKFKNRTSVIISCSSEIKSYSLIEKDKLILLGQAPDHICPNYVFAERKPIKYDQGKGMVFGFACDIITDGGVIYGKDRIIINNAKSVTIRAVSYTGFNGFDKMPSLDTLACKRSLIEKIDNLDKDISAIKQRHIADYRAINDRQSLNLGGKENDTINLLKKAKKQEVDNYLVNLLYDYGKYMIISGSRDTQPLNLQGQWNESVRPPWSSNLTTNINFQMNYWGASACALDECLEPFYNALKEIAVSGERTAKVNYGAKGFCCNHNVDIWRMTSPVKGSPSYMFAPLCGVWIANEAFSHQLTSNGKVRDDIAKIVISATEFILDYMVEYKGKLTTCPSTSPEASYSFNGKTCSLGYSSAFETGLIKQCLNNCLSISDNKALNKRVQQTLDKMYGYVKTSTGINEWQEERQITDKGHRHFSPLYSLYPAKIITYYGDKELLKMCEQLFDYRLFNANNSIGWSAAWAICLSARLRQTDRAYELVKGMMARSIYPNLFGYHPPSYFQIDGNLGFIAGVNEMLITEESGIIEFLPCCPIEWKDGSMTGYKVLGAKVDFVWKNGEIVEITSDREIKVNKINLSKTAKLNNAVIVER